MKFLSRASIINQATKCNDFDKVTLSLVRMVEMELPCKFSRSRTGDTRISEKEKGCCNCKMQMQQA